DRTRESTVHDEDYCRIRNHLIDFLWGRAGGETRDTAGPRSARKSASITPIPQPAHKGDSSDEPRTTHGAHPASQAQEQDQLGRPGGYRRQKQGVGDSGATGTDDVDGGAGGSGGSRARVA